MFYFLIFQSSYNEFALFFHDTYGGSVIAVLWKPSSMEFKDFKVFLNKFSFILFLKIIVIINYVPFFQTSNTNGRKIIKKDDRTGIITDVDSILEGFHILGEGLVEDIENITNLSL